MRIFISKKELVRNEKAAFIIGQIWQLKNWTDLAYFDHGGLEKRILKLFESEGLTPIGFDEPVERLEKGLLLLRDAIKSKGRSQEI